MMQNRLLVVTFEGVTKILIVTLSRVPCAYSHKVPNVVLYHYYYIIIIIKIIYHNIRHRLKTQISDFLFLQCDT
jgi:hypothetical protein